MPLSLYSHTPVIAEKTKVIVITIIQKEDHQQIFIPKK
tara:strand:- start:508 stop:621 length:114 start_codon:yes stop_codon:yes gene_type:complete